jgi:pteridine reductase
VGKAIVLELAKAGFRVAFTFHRSQKEAEALLAAYPQQLLALPCELSDSASRRQLVAGVQEHFPHLSALVNNAAVFAPTPLDQLSLEELRDFFAVNLEAPLFLARDLAPLLRQGQGCIVNLADIYAFTPLPRYTAYVLSKAALVALTRQLAVELAPQVRVNAVAPGIAAFPEDYDEATRQRLLSRTLLKRPGSPEEIARVVRFLLLEAPTVTGQVLAVDGGRLLNPF